MNDDTEFSPAQVILTPMEALLSMTDYLWGFMERCGDELALCVADLTVDDDGLTSDPAAWDDWLASVDRIKRGEPPRSSGSRRA